jgi:hedgehog protein
VLPISDVKIGDEILALSSDGSLQFSEVLLFLDRDPLSPRLYYEIETESGSKISLTPSHLLFVSDDNSTEFSKQLSRVEFAKNVQKGQFLYTSSLGDIKSMTRMKDNDESKKELSYLDRIVRIETKIGTGAYAPLTREGNLIVNNITASCYAVINDQSIAHWSFLPIRLLENIKDSFESIAYLLHLRKHQSNNYLVSSHQNGVHWYPRMLYSLSKYFIPSDKMY